MSFTSIRMSLIAIIVLLISSCSMLPSKIEKLDAKVGKVQLTKPTLTDAVLLFNVNIENPNSFPINVSKLTYNLKLNDQDFLAGTLDQGMELAAGATTSIEVPLSIRYEDVFNGLKQFSRNSSTEYTLEGRVFSGLFSVPISKTGELKLPDASALLR